MPIGVGRDSFNGNTRCYTGRVPRLYLKLNGSITTNAHDFTPGYLGLKLITPREITLKKSVQYCVLIFG